ncbi:hypothetical protein BV898_18486 [Hypsibius exemplaris]|uniref:Protein sleepless n=1 Tax=Hypsibius exemplaris TaxID=2072580 RepID=A0A9X6RNH8_HYPEX|nr:hypothetical protein BV898_18486 [Hypsibius exemplaris]
MNALFLIFLIAGTCATSGLAFKCYDCATGSGSGSVACSDPDRYHGVLNTMECTGYCFKRVQLQAQGVGSLTRGCVPNDIYAPPDGSRSSCVDTGVDRAKYRTCGCTANLCNAAPPVKPQLFFITIFGSVVITLIITKN